MTVPEPPWRRMVELEHEAVWWYQTVAGRPSLAPAAQDDLARHRRERDALSAELADQGVTAPPPQPGYLLPPRTDQAYRHHSADLELRLAATGLAVLGIVSADDRARPTVIAAIRAAARSAHRWGVAPMAFPGLDRA